MSIFNCCLEIRTIPKRESFLPFKTLLYPSRTLIKLDKSLKYKEISARRVEGGRVVRAGENENWWSF